MAYQAYYGKKFDVKPQSPALDGHGSGSSLSCRASRTTYQRIRLKILLLSLEKLSLGYPIRRDLVLGPISSRLEIIRFWNRNFRLHHLAPVPTHYTIHLENSVY